ncbi:unnamed protein product [Bursaphelenchus xylophilus]|uniref:(pine wood nematode) hypothetical protein n=1 Tax=Bursaphelenchus xylophilus TaxID=6326 RepID=A0A1I7SDJ3_BURXY|nr:unnamed protein product [Bursaphelenchus xylophilus]CAG9120783.1 unnamed protein product [Bursaphelenchus xylophilus]
MLIWPEKAVGCSVNAPTYGACLEPSRMQQKDHEVFTFLTAEKPGSGSRLGAGAAQSRSQEPAPEPWQSLVVIQKNFVECV